PRRVGIGGVGDIGKSVIRDRETLARDGFLMVVVNVDQKTGHLLDVPEIISKGFVYQRGAEDLMEQVKSTVQEVLVSANGSSNGRRRERLQESIGRVLYNETKRRPMIFSVINER
ncbi:MAG TPA: ribonuclease J, partial [Phototrophicaceae bacterium]|nr:ribonuclease J [Phototrophicaceae bacterium]